MKTLVLCVVVGLAAIGFAATANAHIEYCADDGTYYEVNTSLVHRHRSDCKDPGLKDFIPEP